MSSNISMKKPLLIIIILLLVGIGVAVFIKFPKTHTTNTQPQETTLSGEIISSWNNTSWATDFLSGVSGEITSWTIQSVTWTTNTQSNNPLVYTNTEFWFQLTLPKWWEDYKAFVYNLTSDNNLISMISITLPTTATDWIGIPDPKKTISISSIPDFSSYIMWYAPIVNILIQTSDSYKKDYETCTKDINTDCTTLKDITLWNNKDYYFTYTTRQELPNDIMNRIKLYNNWMEIIKSSFQSF